MCSGVPCSFLIFQMTSNKEPFVMTAITMRNIKGTEKEFDDRTYGERTEGGLTCTFPECILHTLFFPKSSRSMIWIN